MQQSEGPSESSPQDESRKETKEERSSTRKASALLFLYAVVRSLSFCQGLRHAEFWLSKQPNKNLLETSDVLSCWPLVFSGVL